MTRAPGPVIAILVLATAVPLVMAALAIVFADGFVRIAILVLAVAGFLNLAPFWPPLLRGDVDRVNEMIRRRTPR